jgi:DNA-binding MarR family transcriptional regulator
MGDHVVSLPPVATRATRSSNVRAALDALRRIVRELRLSSSGSERKLGVSAAQRLVLQLLAEKPGSSVNDLAALTNTDQSSVSVVVRRLTGAKLVSRKAAAEDARRVELRLTPAGRRMVAKGPEPTQRVLFAALDRLKPAELRALTCGLDAVVREMSIGDAPPAMFFEDDGAPARQSPRRKKSRPSR